MFLTFGLMKLELRRKGCWKEFLDYRSSIRKVENNQQRIIFLERCNRAEIIPRFLKFRIPNNGCFDKKLIHEFQKRLLNKELLRAKLDITSSRKKLATHRQQLSTLAPYKILPSIVLHIRIDRKNIRVTQSKKLANKLNRLSDEQKRPLLNIKNTVLLHNVDKEPPNYVMETLQLGPKNSTLVKFDENNVLAELDKLLNFCKKNEVNEDIISDINVKTLAYIKNCRKQKPSRNIHLTKQYLKQNGLIAVPFDKGIGICIMPIETYKEKIKDIINLPQFEKIVPKRKNEKHPVFKEEEKVIEKLKELHRTCEISDKMYEKFRPTGSQAPRLYGQAKVHKTNVPLRPVLSMPGSAYHNIADQIAKWLKVVDECNIKTSSNDISENIGNIELDPDEEMISFDVTALYTNVPVKEAIEDCTELLYSGRYPKPPISKETFKTLTELCTCDVLMQTHDGYYRQKDGLAMGSPPAPLLANGWLHKYDARIKGEAKTYARYMDDILRDIKTKEIESKLKNINEMHESLKFTCEREQNNSIPFLDMKIIRNGRNLSTTWYTKPTDTGLTMNFHAMAPMKYKKSVVSSLTHRIHRACSTEKHFQESLIKGRQILENNEYPPTFYEPIIQKAIKKIQTKRSDSEEPTEEENPERQKIFIEYRGNVTQKFEKSLKQIDAPVIFISTTRKLKTCLPSRKAPVEKFLRSWVVYHIKCSRCDACYVGQTVRHLITRIKEHLRAGPVATHVINCGKEITINDVNVLAQSSKSESHLMTLEALHIKNIQPSLNTKDEYKSRTLTIKL